MLIAEESVYFSDLSHFDQCANDIATEKSLHLFLELTALYITGACTPLILYPS